MLHITRIRPERLDHQFTSILESQSTVANRMTRLLTSEGTTLRQCLSSPGHSPPNTVFWRLWQICQIPIHELAPVRVLARFVATPTCRSQSGPIRPSAPLRQAKTPLVLQSPDTPPLTRTTRSSDMVSTSGLAVLLSLPLMIGIRSQKQLALHSYHGTYGGQTFSSRRRPVLRLLRPAKRRNAHPGIKDINDLSLYGSKRRSSKILRGDDLSLVRNSTVHRRQSVKGRDNAQIKHEHADCAQTTHELLYRTGEVRCWL